MSDINNTPIIIQKIRHSIQDTGDTLQGTLTFDNNNTINGLPNPTLEDQVANMGYVDKSIQDAILSAIQEEY